MEEVFGFYLPIEQFCAILNYILNTTNVKCERRKTNDQDSCM